MGATAWFYVAFAAVVVMIVATVWGAMVLEAGARPPGREQDAATPAMSPARRTRWNAGPRERSPPILHRRCRTGPRRPASQEARPGTWAVQSR